MKEFHIIIKQYRIVYVSLIFFVCFMAWDMWAWYKGNADALELASSGAYGAGFLAVLGMVKYALEGLRQDSDHD